MEFNISYDALQTFDSITEIFWTTLFLQYVCAVHCSIGKLYYLGSNKLYSLHSNAIKQERGCGICKIVY